VRYSVAGTHTDDAGARARLVWALRGLLVQASDDTSRLLLRVALALALDPGEAPVTDTAETREALEHARSALRIDPRSVVAAASCARLAASLGDAEAAIAAAVSNAELAADPPSRAAFLTQAAGQLLLATDARLGSRAEILARAGDLLDRALEAAPESAPAAGLLVAVRTEDGGRDRLIATLRAALDRARSADTIVSLGDLIVSAASAPPPDRVLAIDVLRRVLAAAPGRVPSLRALADVYLAQGTIGEAVDALEEIAKRARDPQVRLGVLFELADLYAGGLSRPAEAERVLRAALEIDPANARALRALVSRRRAADADAAEIGTLLARLGEAEASPEAKSATLAELAALRLAGADKAAAEGALIEAIANAPSPALLGQLLELHVRAPADQARALEAVVARSKALERVDAATLGALGQIMVDTLGRFAEGVEHLRAAVTLSPRMHEVRASLGKGLVHMGAGADAIGVLVPMVIAPNAQPLVSLKDPASALASLEAAFAGAGRPEEAIVSRELRAIAGGLDDGTHVGLRTRRLPSYDPAAASVVFDRASLRASVVPPEAQGVLLEIALALGGVEDKIVRTDLDELGILPRDRVSSNKGHPLVMQLQRIARMLGIASPELVVSDQIGFTRVAITPDEPWVLAPEALAAQPEPAQAASLARVATRIALGVPWLEELPPAHVHAVVCSAMRHVVPTFASDLRGTEQEQLVEDYAKPVGRAIGRRQKKALAEVAAKLGSAPTPTLEDAEQLVLGVARAGLRVAFLVTGDLLSTLDDLRFVDAAFAQQTGTVGPGALAATLDHPLAGDVARFALHPGATSLRWRLGTLWAPPR
jgi:tetratricopeptide (TPR) repeat protein